MARRGRKSIFRRYLIVHARIKSDPNDHLCALPRSIFVCYGKKPPVFLGTHIFGVFWPFRQEAAERDQNNGAALESVCILNINSLATLTNTHSFSMRVPWNYNEREEMRIEREKRKSLFLVSLVALRIG